jgi:hypothetical protein
MADPGFWQLIRSTLRLFVADTSVSWLTLGPWGWPKHFKADTSISWLNQIPWGWPRFLAAYPSILWLTQVFLG